MAQLVPSCFTSCLSGRQPEFSQLDMEMAFMDENAIMSLVEEMVLAVFDEVHFSALLLPSPL